jgi:hypothetical protein
LRYAGTAHISGIGELTMQTFPTNPHLENRKLAGALRSISTFIERKKPRDLEEAEAMLALIQGICEERLAEEREATQ